MSEREQVWRQRIEWQQRSGLTVAECCKADRVSEASFYRWKKLLMELPSAAADERPRAPRRTAVQASGSMKQVSQFVPIVVRGSFASSAPQSTTAIDSRNGSCIRIELPNGVMIHVGGELDGQRLGDMVMAAGQIRNPAEQRLPGTASRGAQQHEVTSC